GGGLVGLRERLPDRRQLRDVPLQPQGHALSVRAEHLARLREGASLADVQSVLGTDDRPVTERSGERTLIVLRRPEHGVRVFFDDDGGVRTVRFDSPFPGAVRGIRIGATKDEVRRLLGRPDRPWPVDDGVDRWLYDQPEFIRVDFDPATDTVSTIFR